MINKIRKFIKILIDSIHEDEFDLEIRMGNGVLGG